MENSSDLNERAQHLLKVLIERYIQDGQPVGSRALSRGTGVNLSPATVRNVMADLEDCGLVCSPHTSAGRVPTVTGYRMFIDSLLTVKPLENQAVNQLKHDLGGRSIITISSRVRQVYSLMLPKWPVLLPCHGVNPRHFGILNFCLYRDRVYWSYW